MTSSRLQDLTVGRWQSILPALKIPLSEAQLHKGRHGPCPLCGGTDRFRLDNRGGRGSFICSRCGAGSGIDLVMRFHKVQFLEAKRMIEEHLPNAPVMIPKARGSVDVGRLERTWLQAQHLDGCDLASCYLAKRGLKLCERPGHVRMLHSARCKLEDDTLITLPAMVSRIVGERSFTLHYTFLDPETGNKADVRPNKRLAPGRFPESGAVRLAPAAEIMGIAEGVETALSASQLFGMPVWAATSAAPLVKWDPPTEAREIVIFGDNDESFAGQHAAFALAQKLTAAGYGVEVRIPPRVGTDWNDVLVAKGVSR